MKALYVFGLLFILIAGLATAADCTYYTYASKTDGGSDYFGVTSTAVNTTTFGADQLYSSYTAFTPRLNFTQAVKDTIVGQAAGSTSDIHWETQLTPSLTLVTASDGTPVGTGNYTVTNSTARRWIVNWTTSTFQGQDINVSFTRTFVKCGPGVTTPTCDDLILSPGTIYTGSSTANWLTIVAGTSYGGSSTFKLNNASLGSSIEGKNWAVTWSYTERTCASTQADSATYNGIANTKNLAYAGLALLAVMILVMVSWAIIQIFKGGTADLTTIAVVAIGGGIVIMVAYYIIYFIAKALGG